MISISECAAPLSQVDTLFAVPTHPIFDFVYNEPGVSGSFIVGLPFLGAYVVLDKLLDGMKIIL